MKGFLLDTSVVSLFAPGRHLPDEVRGRLRSEADRVYLPTIAVAEIAEGICGLRRAGGVARADAYAAWLDGLIATFGDRLAPFDVPAAMAAGEIGDVAVAAGRHPGFADVAIAAIAKSRELAILTRNLRHFEPLGVPAFDPVLGIPAGSSP